MKERFNIVQIKGKLVVSCQALPEEPLHSPFIMGRMAYAAMLGGADAIRCNSVEDIREIKKMVNLPLVAIIKAEYKDSSVYITPTMHEVDALVNEGVDIIATDSTKRLRPNGVDLDTFFSKLKAKYPQQLFMADCSNYEEGMHAAKLGFDLIGTTMAGYTEYTVGTCLPDIDMIKRLVKDCGKPVIAEGGIWTPEQLISVKNLGAWAVVVGSAISRPMLITERFAKAMHT